MRRPTDSVSESVGSIFSNTLERRDTPMNLVIHRGIEMPEDYVKAWDEMCAFAEYCKAHPIDGDESEAKWGVISGA